MWQLSALLKHLKSRIEPSIFDVHLLQGISKYCSGQKEALSSWLAPIPPDKWPVSLDHPYVLVLQGRLFHTCPHHIHNTVNNIYFTLFLNLRKETVYIYGIQHDVLIYVSIVEWQHQAN